jgi:type II secretory ATPase GspE/PulE/Tfp pilus assembly ATPase PilB-like protein
MDRMVRTLRQARLSRRLQSDCRAEQGRDHVRVGAAHDPAPEPDIIMVGEIRDQETT